MTLSFPNVWNLVSDSYDVYGRAALLVTAAALGVGLLLLMRAKPVFTKENTLNIAIWSVWTCVMFLPNMHERYAFFLNILVLIAAVVNVKLLGYAALLEILTLIMYAKCFFRGSTAYNVPMYICAGLYVAAYVFFSVHSFPASRKKVQSD